MALLNILKGHSTLHCNYNKYKFIECTYIYKCDTKADGN